MNRTIFAASLLLCACALEAQEVKVWYTTPDESMLIAPRTGAIEFTDNYTDRQAPIVVDERQCYQQMEGFGFALTGGSAQMLMGMSADRRHEVLVDLFGKGPEHSGISYLRLTIGASDMNEFVFSYDDMPAGKEDWRLKQFSLSQDLKDVVPVMKEILSINPDITVMASPWSAPVWMKESGDVRGGKLRKDCYDVYARYFVKYVQEMAKHGIGIDAVTVQNEPLNSRNTPSMPWSPQDQAEFIGQYLGPAFEKAGLDTRIILFDHNCDRPDYPLTILADPAASRYAGGVAFHQYMGDQSGMTTVHTMRPDQNIYFTEQMIIDRSGSKSAQIAPVVRRVIVDVTRNWSSNVILWNLAADTEAGPHTGNGGCPFCFGAITVDGDKVEKNIAYYAIAQVSTFVPAGSYRIASTAPSDPNVVMFEDEQNPGIMRAVSYPQSDVVPNVAFSTPDGRIVLILSNISSSDKTVFVRYHGKYAYIPVESGAVATCVWSEINT